MLSVGPQVRLLPCFYRRAVPLPLGCPGVRRIMFGRNASCAWSWMQVVVTVM